MHFCKQVWPEIHFKSNTITALTIQQVVWHLKRWKISNHVVNYILVSTYVHDAYIILKPVFMIGRRFPQQWAIRFFSRTDQFFWGIKIISKSLNPSLCTCIIKLAGLKSVSSNYWVSQWQIYFGFFPYSVACTSKGSENNFWIEATSFIDAGTVCTNTPRVTGIGSWGGQLHALFWLLLLWISHFHKANKLHVIVE